MVCGHGYSKKLYIKKQILTNYTTKSIVIMRNAQM